MQKTTQRKSQLLIYEKNGFKFFLCNPDKSPSTKGDWKNKKNQISFKKAEKLQEKGIMIGAIIPKDIFVIDIDKNISTEEAFSILLDGKKTFAVRTKNKGLHVYVSSKNKDIFKKTNNEMELRQHNDYIIVAGSPFYHIESNVSII